MIRFVLDTNVVVSIALPGSRLQPLVEAWQGGRCRLLLSTEIFEEYLRVLTYPRFQLSSEDVRRTLERELRPYAEPVRVTSRINVVDADPSDNKFLACAVDGDADWIVTGDRHLLRLSPFRGIRIGSPAQFLDSV
ncbi:MAG: putative toxin-antitoxin system toxin component, PIN family [Candidatus Omnitrophica bacterium]|nr:putative toxin-antitoxin system toxin component, PIN family [Candidatus Omnitrophota bacterium]